MVPNRKKNRNKWLIGGFVIALTILGMSLLSLESYSVYFYTPDEAVSQSETLQGQDIKVGGMVKEGSIEWEPEKLSLKFIVTEFGRNEILVSHTGTPPDMFKENQGVVVEGKIAASGKEFLAKNLMVKHSEEYKIPDQKHSLDKQLLEKSLFKK